MADLDTALTDTADATVRVPANIMSLLRQSYDSREKVLDWILAITVAGLMVLVFRENLSEILFPDAGPNAGRADEPVPNQALASAFPYAGRSTDRLYTYNLPPSRDIRYARGPSATRPPGNPSLPVAF